MRRFITALTLVAFAAGFAPLDWRLALAEDVSPETSQRLREAVDRLRDGENCGSTGVPPLERLDETALEDLVAPFALYPDALLAQVLVAATYPDQILRANDLIARTDGLSDAELATALEAEDWDPSVLVLLSGFPTVITRMAEDPEATRRLGVAMVDQDQDVLAAAQRLRVKAEAAGNLSSNAAQTVTRSDDEISIRPAKREMVYVPDYDPGTVYVSSRGTDPYVQTQAPAAQSGSTTQTALIAGAVAFGGGLLVSQLFKDDDEPESGWDDYWRQDRVIDWRDRQFYPRSDREARRETWGGERDRYWNRSDQRWNRDEAARRYREEERRSALRWTGYGEPGRDRRELAAWREHAAREQAREERAAEKKREARQERRKEAERREKAEQRAKAEAAAERKREREAEQARDERARREAAKAEAARARDKEQAKKDADRKNADKKAPKPAAQADKKPEHKAKPKAEKKSDQPRPAAKQDKPKQEKARQDKPRQDAPRGNQKPRNGQDSKQNTGKCREGDDRQKCK